MELHISDDGKDIPAGQQIDLPALLMEKHFGLARMYERAALIGEELKIQSQPGNGTRVSLEWKARQSPVF